MDLNQVTVESTDLKRSEDFYSRLGLSVIVRTDRYLRFECPGGSSTFSVELVDESPSRSGVMVYFESDDLDGVCERLKSEGIQFDQGPMDMPWLWREARLRDPDGHQLCLFYGGENRKYPPWRTN
ncbi:MAG TPA: VOC family protein [Acidimicrobiales bacterium]|nr:VOC family protein [Acidimicrobiales bacterium]